VQSLCRHQPSAAEAGVLRGRLEDRQTYANAVTQGAGVTVNAATWRALGDEYLAKRTKDQSIVVRLKPLVASLPGRILDQTPG